MAHGLRNERALGLRPNLKEESVTHPLSDGWVFPEDLVEMFDEEDENCFETSSDDSEAVSKEAARRTLLKKLAAKALTR